MHNILFIFFQRYFLKYSYIFINKKLYHYFISIHIIPFNYNYCIISCWAFKGSIFSRKYWSTSIHAQFHAAISYFSSTYPQVFFIRPSQDLFHLLILGQFFMFSYPSFMIYIPLFFTSAGYKRFYSLIFELSDNIQDGIFNFPQPLGSFHKLPSFNN